MAGARRRRRRFRDGLLGRWMRALADQVRDDERQEMAGIILLGLAGLFIYAWRAPHPGLVGGLMADVLRASLGNAAPIVPFLLAIWGLAALLRLGPLFTMPRRAGLLLAAALYPAFLSMSPTAERAFVAWRMGVGGGLIGALLDHLLLKAFGAGGRLLVLYTMAAVALVLLTGFSAGTALRGLWARLPVGCGGRRAAPEVAEPRPGPADEVPAGAGTGEDPAAALDPAPGGDEPEEEAGGSLTADGSGAPAPVDKPLSGIEATSHPGEDGPGAPGRAAPAETAPGAALTAGGGGEEPSGSRGGAREQFQQLQLHPEGIYHIPPVSLLRSRGPRGGLPDGTRELQAMRKTLEDTLRSFGVDAKVSDVQRGPAVTRFEVQPAPGVKVSRIASLADDIALSMAAAGVRIVAPIPGKAAIGIEVPNREIATVYLRDVLESREFQNSPSRLTVAFGQDIGGRPVVASLDRMVHLLVAGATGSGKSVMVNALLCSLLFKASPHDLRLLLIDPKVVELSAYNGIPHLLTPVVTDPKRAAGCLRWVVKEMEGRYERFAETGARDIARYNQWAAAHQQPGLPYIVVVIDELADLMMVAPAEVEDAIQRLAQMARAAGIHLVVATQRPSVDVITGVIKANIPSRIAFAVASQVDSRTILDMAGAEKLLGKGDMLFYPLGAPKPVRVQGAYLPEPEMEVLLDYVKRQAQPRYDENVLNAEEEEAVGEPGWDDDLFPEAVRVVVETGQASVSIVQRRLRVGYTRAGRLIDMMEERGIVGPHQGPKPREILISQADFQRLFGDGKPA